MRSATDILSISTGRETLLIGPRSAFGVSSQSVLIVDRHSLRHILGMFLSRPNSEELLRPHLRRWGVDGMSMHGPDRHALLDKLANAASSGLLGIAVVPEVTLSFAGASLDDSLRKATPALREADILPPDLVDRMVIVFSMVPDYMEGETRLAFEETVKSLGIAVIAGGVCAWIGAHFIPGVNLAVLAFDLFFLSTEVLHALEKTAKVIEDVRTATSREQLKPAAIALAAVLAVLIVNGVLNRLIKAKQLTKGVGKQGGSSGTSKPSLPKKEAPKKQADTVRSRVDPEPGTGSGNQSRKSDSPPAASRANLDAIKNIPKGSRPDPSTYMSKAEIAAHNAEFKDGASRFMLQGNLKKYGPGQKDGTSFVVPKKEADRIMKETGGDPRKLEAALGLPKGTLDNDALVRVDIPEPAKLGVRVPSGNEAGANDLWLPGGKLPNGSTEGVIDIGNAPPGSFTTTPISPSS